MPTAAGGGRAAGGGGGKKPAMLLPCRFCFFSLPSLLFLPFYSFLLLTSPYPDPPKSIPERCIFERVTVTVTDRQCVGAVGGVETVVMPTLTILSDAVPDSDLM